LRAWVAAVPPQNRHTNTGVPRMLQGCCKDAPRMFLGFSWGRVSLRSAAAWVGLSAGGECGRTEDTDGRRVVKVTPSAAPKAGLPRPINCACSYGAVCYSGCMAGYRRPLSNSEVRQIRRQKGRIFFFSALAVLLALLAMAGLICALHYL
jgi:hypothetical protein